MLLWSCAPVLTWCGGLGQGEANADQKIKGNDQTQYYAAMYQAMIADWRERKGMGDFAHMTVQLPPSVAATTALDRQMGTGRMQIRLAEAETAPHSGGLTDISGVAVALDCGGKSAWGWDHPPNKNEIARRLALQTVHAAYAQQGRIPNALPCPDPGATKIPNWTSSLSHLPSRLMDIIYANAKGSSLLNAWEVGPDAFL